MDVAQPNYLKQQGGLSRIDRFCGAYTQDELTQYFKGLREEIDKDPATSHPAVVLLSGNDHTIMTGYDPSKKENKPHCTYRHTGFALHSPQLPLLS